LVKDKNFICYIEFELNKWYNNISPQQDVKRLTQAKKKGVKNRSGGNLCGEIF